MHAPNAEANKRREDEPANNGHPALRLHLQPALSQNAFGGLTHGVLPERLGSGDGEREASMTRQMPYEPLPASVLLGRVVIVKDVLHRMPGKPSSGDHVCRRMEQQ